jgi:hypothetical protein
VATRFAVSVVSPNYVSELPVLDDVPVREFSCADDINVSKRWRVLGRVLRVCLLLATRTAGEEGRIPRLRTQDLIARSSSESFPPVGVALSGGGVADA